MSEQKYFINSENRLYFKTIFKNITWGWYFWYDNKFRMCAIYPNENNLTEISKEEFDKFYFVEKL